MIVTKKFLKMSDQYRLYEGISQSGVFAYSGSIQQIDDDIYLLLDTQDRHICAIFDAKSFYEALMESDTHFLFEYKKN